ncbi:FxSxx-COOH system tetratricopeptide repeat protein [Actinokineospora globicatena]|uniref:FxSxx-COOH system tetratricopeptide repeat protein n=1 Tax=Actinokineospora globicatena TaxID=103729 RepID=UPI0020A54503|nr:FxSxx-COOH system tetratricopeptide repeat protein [Actinokineospora globicatena]
MRKIRFLLAKPKVNHMPLGSEPELEPGTPGASSAVLGRIVSPQIVGVAEVVGRDQELADLRAAFTAEQTRRGPRVQVLTGMGGVGKTSLARAYAERHLDDYDIVWWVRAEDRETLDAEYRSLLELVRPVSEATLVRDAMQAANLWLSQHKQPWLLVLDNVSNAAALRGLYPAKGNGHVLVTSQSTGTWPAGVHAVAPLGTEAAVELLTTVSQDGDADTAAELADELDGLPLALTQAASFTATTGIDLTTYLRLYRARSADLLADGQPDDYPHTVATTWLLAIERLTDPAREVLDTIAYLAPDAIPTSLLHPLFDDELTLLRAIGDLRSHSLITRGPDTTITVHRLVQAATRHRHGDGLRHANRARDLVAIALPDPVLTLTTMKTWRDLHSHVLAVGERLPDDPETFDLFLRQAHLYDDMDHPRAAATQIDALVVRMTPSLGPESDRVLRARSLSATSVHAYDPARAKELFADLVRIQGDLFGADHLDTLVSRHELGRCHYSLGEFERASELFGPVASARSRLLGPRAYLTLISRSCDADCATALGRFDEAIATYRDVAAIATAEFGEADIRTIWLHLFHADAVGEAGDPGAARDLHEFLLDQLREQRGPFDTTTIGMHLSLAKWTAIAGNPTRAAHLMFSMLAALRGAQGRKSPLVKQFEEGLHAIKTGQARAMPGKSARRR